MNNPETQNLKINEILQHQSTCLYIKKTNVSINHHACMEAFSSAPESLALKIQSFFILNVFLPSSTTDRFSNVWTTRKALGDTAPSPHPLPLTDI